MRFLSLSTLLTIYTSTLLTNALPLSGLHNGPQIARRKATYSVVPVDGGEPAGAAPLKTQIVTKDSTQTITEPPKTLPPTTATMLSTTIVTESETPTTIITTITTTSTPVTTPATAPEDSPSIRTTLEIVTSMVSTADTVTIISTPTLTPYDDGNWHTKYYKAAELSSSSKTTSSASADLTPSPTVDVDSTILTGIPSNGTYALMLRGKHNLQPSNTTTTGITLPSSVMGAVITKPPMPTLPKTSEVINPTEVPSIDIAKHMVPGFGR